MKLNLFALLVQIISLTNQEPPVEQPVKKVLLMLILYVWEILNVILMRVKLVLLIHSELRIRHPDV